VNTASGLSQLGKVLGAIVGPATLVTSLLYYFGWMHAYWFFEYFGVNSTLLGLTTEDYLMRSADGLFVPMAVVAGLGLLALWTDAALRTRIAGGPRPRWVGVFTALMTISGLLLALSGFASMFVTTVLADHVALAPVCLAFGVLLVVYALHLRRVADGRERADRDGGPQWGVLIRWMGVFVLVGLSLFWAANDYSAAVGRARALQFAAELSTLPRVALYSDRPLGIDAPGVVEVRCQDGDAGYRYRYDGLRLVLQSGDQYLFLPAAWSPADGVALLMPRAASLRLEFQTPSSAERDRQSTCSSVPARPLQSPAAQPP
jgi:hypothetical protein